MASRVFQTASTASRPRPSWPQRVQSARLPGLGTRLAIERKRDMLNRGGRHTADSIGEGGKVTTGALPAHGCQQDPKGGSVRRQRAAVWGWVVCDVALLLAGPLAGWMWGSGRNTTDKATTIPGASVRSRHNARGEVIRETLAVSAGRRQGSSRTIRGGCRIRAEVGPSVSRAMGRLPHGIAGF